MAFGNEPLDGSLTIPPSTVYSKESNTFPALVAEPGAYKDSFSNQSSVPVMSFLRPITRQSNHAVTSSGGKVLTCTFSDDNIAGNSIVVRVGMGEIEGANITLTITDTLGNVYMQAGSPAQQSTTLEAAIFYSVGSNGKGILAGTNTVTVTIAGSSSVNTGIGVQIDEVFGLITWPGALDQTNIGSNAGSTNVSTGAVVPAVPNELAFVVVASAGGTITPGANWNNDTGGTLSPVGGGLVSFEAQSRLHTQNTSLTPSATLSGSNAWCAAIATFKTVIVPVEGTVTANLDATNSAHLGNIDTATGTPSDANTVASIIGRLTKIRDVLLGFVFDSTDKLRTSLYVKTSAAGDTVLTLGQTTKSASLSVALASNQEEPVNVGTPTPSSISVGVTSTAVVTPGANAKFLLLINDSANTIYLNISGGAAVLNAGVRLNANGGSILFDRYVPSAAITAISSVAASNLLVEVG